MEEFMGNEYRARFGQRYTIHRSVVCVCNSTIINDACFPGAVGTGFKVTARMSCDGLIARVELRDQTHNVAWMLAG